MPDVDLGGFAKHGGTYGCSGNCRYCRVARRDKEESRHCSHSPHRRPERCYSPAWCKPPFPYAYLYRTAQMQSTAPAFFRHPAVRYVFIVVRADSLQNRHEHPLSDERPLSHSCRHRQGCTRCLSEPLRVASCLDLAGSGSRL